MIPSISVVSQVKDYALKNELERHSDGHGFKTKIENIIDNLVDAIHKSNYPTQEESDEAFIEAISLFMSIKNSVREIERESWRKLLLNEINDFTKSWS